MATSTPAAADDEDETAVAAAEGAAAAAEVAAAAAAWSACCTCNDGVNIRPFFASAPLACVAVPAVARVLTPAAAVAADEEADDDPMR